MDYYEKTDLPFVLWPSIFWLGRPGETHGGGYPYEFEPGGPENPRRERPIVEGYYDPKLQALAWYPTQHPAPHHIKRVIRWLAKYRFRVKILDRTNYLKTKERYPRWRDFNQMRPESVMGRDNLIELLVEYARIG